MRAVASLILAAFVVGAESQSANTTGIVHGAQEAVAASLSDTVTRTLPRLSASSTSTPTSISSHSDAQSSSGAVTSPFPVTSMPWQTTGSDLPIRGGLSTYCYPLGSPCTVRCASDDVICLSDASSAVEVCKPQWAAYQNASATWALSKYGSGSYTLTRVLTDHVVSTIFSSYSTDLTEAFSNLYASAATYHPVYAFGSGVLRTVSTGYYTFTREFASTDVRTIATSITVESYRDTITTITDVDFVPVTAAGFPESPPACSITQLSPVECQQCQISGGTVELYFWPPPERNSTSANSTITKAPEGRRTTVVDGITMISPSVYISLHTVYASDGCRQIGANHTQTVLAMDPDKVSTLFGARGAGYVPVDSAQIDYRDLVGAVPASQYERNPACARFGCITLKNDYYRPILSIPPEIRNLDPAWSGCRLDLGGLYDPPVALQPVANIAQPTVPGAGPSPGPTADPGTSPANPSPQPTFTPSPPIINPPTSKQAPNPALPEQSPSSPSHADPSVQLGPSVLPSQPTLNPPAAQQSATLQQNPSDSANPIALPQSQSRAEPMPASLTPSSSAEPSGSNAQGSGTLLDPAPPTPAGDVSTGQSQAQTGSGAGGGLPGPGSIIASIIGITAPDGTLTREGSRPATTTYPTQTSSAADSESTSSNSHSTGGSPDTSTVQTTNLASRGTGVSLIALSFGVCASFSLAL